jgi:hypothetical protein
MYVRFVSLMRFQAYEGQCSSSTLAFTLNAIKLGLPINNFGPIRRNSIQLVYVYLWPLTTDAVLGLGPVRGS